MPRRKQARPRRRSGDYIPISTNINSAQDLRKICRSGSSSIHSGSSNKSLNHENYDKIEIDDQDDEMDLELDEKDEFYDDDEDHEKMFEDDDEILEEDEEFGESESFPRNPKNMRQQINK
jgi:uncharacterized protein YneR